MTRRVLAAAAIVCVFARPAPAQTFSQRGFVQADGVFYPETAPNDSVRAVGDFLAREELFVHPIPWLQFAGGVDLRANTHDQVNQDWNIDFLNRGIRRPRLAISRLSATFNAHALAVDVGKQFIRWGKTDIVTPTDRFAPRDYLNVFDNEFLAVTGVRASFERGGETFEGVWVPWFTPSRMPLLDQRWTVVPAEAADVPIVDAGGAIPGGSQAGVRWSHVGRGFETSASFFDGYNTLPNVLTLATFQAPGSPLPPPVAVLRSYPSIKMYGGDAAVPTRWFTIKGEAAYFTTPSPITDEYVLYVVQFERQSGEWVFVGGYAGEVITVHRATLTFAPDRGLTKSIVGRASYTIDPNRSVAFETAIRQNGDGFYGKAEYSQAHGAHWRATITGVLLAGEPGDFIGEFNRNSFLEVAIRYSF